MKSSQALAMLVVGWAFLASDAIWVKGQDSKAAEKAAQEKRKSAAKESEAVEPAGPSSPVKLLSDRGLIKKDRQFVLDETSALEKFSRVKDLLFDFQKASLRSGQIAAYDAQTQEMTAQVQALQQRVNAAQSQLNNRIPGSVAYGRARQMVNQQQAPLRNQQNQDKALINQINAQLKAASSKAPKKDERTLASSELERTRQTYVASVLELEALVAPLVAEYHELARDKEIIHALEKVSHDDKKTYKLGPSPELTSAVKIVAEVKKSLPRSSKPSTKSSLKAKTKLPKSAL